MNNDILTKSINKGVPTSTFVPVLLRYMDLYDILEDRENFDDAMEVQLNKLFDSIFPSRKGFRFMRSFEIRTNPETLEREIIASPSAFINSLRLGLNCSNLYTKCYDAPIICESYLETSKDFYNRIKCLSKIKTLEEFKKEFPYLYKKYELDREEFKSYMDFKQDVINNPNISPDKKIKFKVAFWNEYSKGRNNSNFDINSLFKLVTSSLYRLPELDSSSFVDVQMCDMLLKEIDKHAPEFNVSKYTSRLANDISWMVRNKDKVISELVSKPLDFSFLSEKEHKKLDLYITYMYLNSAEIAPSLEDKQKFLYYISNYFFENQDLLNTDFSITIGRVPEIDEDFFKFDNKDGIVVTPKNLYERYRKMLIENPDLRVVDSSKFDFSNMSLEDVNSYMEKYLKDLSATWDFLPPCDIEDVPVVSVSATTADGKVLSDIEREELQRRIIDLFMEKKEFYGSTNPMFRVKGKKTFDGYIGYIYPNGKVVLDKFFKNSEKGELAYGNAVYIMNLDDFYDLSKFSKTEIIRDRLCKRFVHSGDWKNRVRKEISSGKYEEKDCIQKKILSNNISFEN